MTRWSKNKFRLAFNKNGYLFVGTFRDKDLVTWKCYHKFGEKEIFFLNNKAECRKGTHPAIGIHVLEIGG